MKNLFILFLLTSPLVLRAANSGLIHYNAPVTVTIDQNFQLWVLPCPECIYASYPEASGPISCAVLVEGQPLYYWDAAGDEYFYSILAGRTGPLDIKICVSFSSGPEGGLVTEEVDLTVNVLPGTASIDGRIENYDPQSGLLTGWAAPNDPASQVQSVNLLLWPCSRPLDYDPFLEFPRWTTIYGLERPDIVGESGLLQSGWETQFTPNSWDEWCMDKGYSITLGEFVITAIAYDNNGAKKAIDSRFAYIGARPPEVVQRESLGPIMFGESGHIDLDITTTFQAVPHVEVGEFYSSTYDIWAGLEGVLSGENGSYVYAIDVIPHLFQGDGYEYRSSVEWGLSLYVVNGDPTVASGDYHYFPIIVLPADLIGVFGNKTITEDIFLDDDILNARFINAVNSSLESNGVVSYMAIEKNGVEMEEPILLALGDTLSYGQYKVVAYHEEQGNYNAATAEMILTVEHSTVDSDENGIQDWWEEEYFGQTGVEPSGDEDGDGLSNLMEYHLGTHPLQAAVEEADPLATGLKIHTPSSSL